MKFNFWTTILMLATAGISSCSLLHQGQLKRNDKLLNIFQDNFNTADSQLLFLRDHLPENKFPKTFFAAKDSYEFSGSGWWCSGFYPGSLLYAYNHTRDTFLLLEAKRILKTLSKEQYNTTTHDLGFMMFCSFGKALEIAPDPSYKNILIQSAKSLATRFDPKVGCIKSWDGKKSEYLVIIDNMMNLELLFWATRQTGDSSFYKMAVTHANTTLQHHFRPDYSSFHVVNYNSENGTVIQKKTAQGYSDASAWARGQAWGLYGYTVMYRETKDPKYLKQAENIAGFLLNHPNRTEDGVPYWDYNAPDIPNALRDASAGAIMASAYLELMQYTGRKMARKYHAEAEKILTTLSNTTYKAAVGTNGGFLLKHGVGHIPQKTEVDVPLTYGDYYFLEAMHRYQSFDGN